MPAVAAVTIQKRGQRPPEAATKAELLQVFDSGAAACRETVAALSDQLLLGDILVAPGISKPLLAVLRGRGLMNHLIHHRGQLSVYLRLLDSAVPGMYGPSADEK
jgi:uncharacterized damage-inducible protein DinB